MRLRAKNFKSGVFIASAAFLISTLLASSAPSASGYPRESQFGCNLDNINMIFHSDFPTLRRAEVVQGIQKWNHMEDQYGNRPWTNGIGNDHLAFWVDLPNGTNGTFNCDPFFSDGTWFQFGNHLSGQRLVGVAAHEAGHVHGLAHSGRTDNNRLKPPYMATCLNQTEMLYRGSKPAWHDDYGAFFENITNGVSANQSFENGKAAWSSTDSYSIQTSGGSEGPNFGRLSYQGGTNRIYSWVRQQEPDTAYDARINFRATGSTTAVVRLRLQVRRVDFAPNTTSCDWPNIYGQNLNYNDATPRSGFWTTREIAFSVLPNSGWQYATTNDWFGALNNQWQGADLKVQISVWGASDNVVDFDNTRVRTQ